MKSLLKPFYCVLLTIGLAACGNNKTQPSQSPQDDLPALPAFDLLKRQAGDMTFWREDVVNSSIVLDQAVKKELLQSLQRGVYTADSNVAEQPHDFAMRDQVVSGVILNDFGDTIAHTTLSDKSWHPRADYTNETGIATSIAKQARIEFVDSLGEITHVVQYNVQTNLDQDNDTLTQEFQSIADQTQNIKTNTYKR